MTIDNSAFVLRSRKLMYIMTVSFFVLVLLFMTFDYLDLPVSLPYKEYFILSLLLIYIFFHIRRFILDFNFISICDDNGRLVIKYYSLMLLTGKHKTIEIPFQSFEKYKLEKSIFGKKTSLILYQKINGKLAKYPKLSLSGLSNDELAKLKSRLDVLTSLN
jgi:hypothetical protein